MNKKENLLWVDIETTGLDARQDSILEVAIVATDKDLNILAEYSALIHQPDYILQTMNKWCKDQHSKSGLIEEVRRSEMGEYDVGQEVIGFINRWSEPGASPMCGSSIAFDRKFLIEHMPDVADAFHYRNIDVSTVKELMKRWRPDVLPLEKKGTHRALADIKESIEELRMYKTMLV